jgi:hypothetical protein
MTYRLANIANDEVIATVYDGSSGITLHPPREGELVYFSHMLNPWLVVRVVHSVFRVGHEGDNHNATIYVYIRHMTKEETAQEAVFNIEDGPV